MSMVRNLKDNWHLLDTSMVRNLKDNWHLLDTSTVRNIREQLAMSTCLLTT